MSAIAAVEMNNFTETIAKLVEDKVRIEREHAVRLEELTERNHRLDNELHDKTMRLNNAIERYRGLKTAYDESQNKCKAVTNEHTRLKAKVTKDKKINDSHLNAVYREKNGQLYVLRNQNRTLHEHVMRYRNQNRELQEELTQFKDKCAEWESNYYDAQKDADDAYLQQREKYRIRLSDMGEKYIFLVKKMYAMAAIVMMLVTRNSDKNKTFKMHIADKDAEIASARRVGYTLYVLLFIVYICAVLQFTYYVMV